MENSRAGASAIGGFRGSERTRKSLLPVTGYIVCFFAVWTFYVLAIYPRMQSLGDRTLLYAIVSISIRFLIWVVPVFLYLKYFDRTSPMEYLKLRRFWVRGVIVGFGLSVLNFFGTMLRFGAPHPNIHNVTWNSILSTSILVGFFEEVPFRGFIFQKFQEHYGFWIASLVSSVLFLAIHFPGWITLHLLNAPIVISIFIFGFVMAVVLRLSKSLWSCVAAHSLNDFISFVLFHV